MPRGAACRRLAGNGVPDFFCEIDKGFNLLDRKAHDDPFCLVVGNPPVYFSKISYFTRDWRISEQFYFKTIIFLNDNEDVAEFRDGVVVILVVYLYGKILPYFLRQDISVSGVCVEKVSSKF
jgi:hypothetical protein